MKPITQAAVDALNLSMVTRYNAAAGAYTPQYRDAGAVLVPSTNRGNVYGSLGTFPALKRFTGATKIHTLDSSSFTILNDEWDVSVGLPMRDVEDNQLISHGMAVAGLGRRGSQLADSLVFGLLNNSFTGLDYTGTAFFASGKKFTTTKGGTTYNNKAVAALDATSLTAGLTFLQGLKDPEGAPVNAGLTLKLVVPSALAYTAKQLVSATTVTTGGQNVLAGAAEVVVCPWLTSATAWFLIAVDPDAPALIYQERKAPGILATVNSPQSEHLIKHKEFLYNCYARAEAGYGFWQKAYGSTGAGS